MKKTLFVLLLLYCCFGIRISAQRDTLANNSSQYLLVNTKGKSKQSITPRTKIIWLSTKATDTEAASYKIRAIIETLGALKADQIIVLHNGKEIGGKADVVSFKAVAAARKQFEYQNEIELLDGMNKIEIVVQQSDGILKKSYAKIIRKQGRVVEEISSTANDGDKGIYWERPAWSSELTVVENRQINLAVRIHSPVAIQLSDIYILRQGLQKIMPSKDATLVQEAEGKYRFTTRLDLKEEGVNEVAIKVRSKVAGEIVSESLMLRFSPYRPNLHVLSVGTETNLDYTTKDAEDFANCFVTQATANGGTLFSSVTTEVLTGKSANAQAIKTSIERLEAQYKTGAIGKRDLILFYISSHGFLDEKRQLRIQGDDYTPAAPRATSVSYERDIVEVLEAIPCKKLIFIDACYSGGSKSNNGDIDYQLDLLNRPLEGFTTIVSSKGDELSYEDVAWENGAFTEAILEGLYQKQANQNEDQYITINELWAYLQARVPKLVEQVKQKAQHPSLKKNDLGDLPIYYVY
ncbi:MAG: caspase family protein [Bacteroidota bacterium]